MLNSPKERKVRNGFNWSVVSMKREGSKAIGEVVQLHKLGLMLEEKYDNYWTNMAQGLRASKKRPLNEISGGNGIDFEEMKGNPSCSKYGG